MSLIGWWPLHERSGQANDLSGNGNHGTVSGPTQGVGGVGGLSAYSFDGSDDTVNLPDGTEPSGDSERTHSVWVNTTDDTLGRIYSASAGTSNTNGIAYTIRTRDNGGQDEISLSIIGDNKAWDATGIFDGNWHHVVVVLGGSTLSDADCYIDGIKLPVTTSGSNTVNTTSTDIAWGGDIAENRRYWGGNMCDARIYDRALSTAEIRSLYEQGAMAGVPEGTSRYTFDNDDATDSWGSNDGTVNGATFTDGLYGRAASFDGTDDYIAIGDTGVPLDGSQGFTLATWFKTGSNSDQTFINVDGSSGHQMRINQESGGNWTLEMDIGGSSVVQGTQQVTDDTWHHGLVSYIGDKFYLYIDGLLVDTGTDASWTLTQNIELGRREDGVQYTNGELDDVRIYPWALSPQEVKSIYQGWNDLARPTTDDLVSHYKLDGDATDAAGTNDGTVNGATPTSGVRGGAYSFDGTDDSIDLGFSSLTTPFSISAWVLNDSAANGTVVSNFNSTSDDLFFQVQNSGSDFVFALDVASNTPTTSAPTAGVWTHYVGTIDANNIRIYKNGVLEDEVSSDVSDSTAIDNSANYHIGRRPNDSYEWGGDIDEVRIYDRALEPHEIQELYQWGTRGRDLREFTVNKVA